MSVATVSLTVPASHPALPGHFPAKPIVPGVVLLGLVHSLACEQIGFSPGATSWRRIKFLQPVLPEQPVVLELDGNSDQFSFIIMTTSGGLVARGKCQHVQLA
ncbi:MAG: hypothetical protein ACNA7J_00945 [Wenzhouxiangella sp.]